MDVGRYRHNYEGFYENTLYQMSINREMTTTTEGTHASLVGILSILLFLSWWRALKRRSNHPETVWILLEARHLNSFKNSFKETCKYVFSFIIDDRIICSWWLGILNVWFNIFLLHLMFWSKFWKVIDLRSHHPSLTIRRVSWLGDSLKPTVSTTLRPSLWWLASAPSVSSFPLR